MTYEYLIYDSNWVYIETLHMTEDEFEEYCSNAPEGHNYKKYPASGVWQK